jgi:hypothetical protein
MCSACTGASCAAPVARERAREHRGRVGVGARQQRFLAREGAQQAAHEQRHQRDGDAVPEEGLQGAGEQQRAVGEREDRAGDADHEARGGLACEIGGTRQQGARLPR